MSFQPVAFGCAGLGGFAGTICDRLHTHSQLENPVIRLTAVCDPEPERHPQRVAILRDAGVKVFEHYDQLLGESLEAVWLPLPIDLHRAFTEQALAARKAVMCEKPAAGCVDDVDAMIAARNSAKLHAAVGFQDVYQPGNIALQKRIQSGEFGKPHSATLLACWPRGDRYYRRNNWAGKLQRNGVWVLDNPASNALSHFIHLTMFLLGDRQSHVAAPLRLEAELYRANDIECFDTCSLRIHLAGGVQFIVGLTHACDENVEPEIEILTDKARVRILAGKSVEIRNGQTAETISLEGARYGNVIGAFARRLRGASDAPVGATLEMARAHTLAVNGAVQAAPVVDVPGEFIGAATVKDGSPLRVIRGLHGVLRQCAANRQLLHESGLVPWSRPAESIDLSGYCHFAGPRRL
jgi:predicted dehydrogenase